MSVLFVTTCSLTKAAGGTGTFDPETTVCGSGPRHAELLAARREEVRELVKGGNAADWQGVPLKDLDYSRGSSRASSSAAERTPSTCLHSTVTKADSSRRWGMPARRVAAQTTTC